MVSTASHPSTLVCRLVAKVLERIIDIVDDPAQQRTIQAFINELKPWMPRSYAYVRQHPPLFYSPKLDEIAIEVAVDFTPEGLLCFCAWLHRQGLNPSLLSLTVIVHGTPDTSVLRFRQAQDCRAIRREEFL